MKKHDLALLLLKIMQLQSGLLISTQMCFFCKVFSSHALLLWFYTDFIWYITWYFVQAMCTVAMLVLIAIELTSNIPVLPVNILLILRPEM